MEKNQAEIEGDVLAYKGIVDRLIAENKRLTSELLRAGSDAWDACIDYAYWVWVQNKKGERPPNKEQYFKKFEK